MSKLRRIFLAVEDLMKSSEDDKNRKQLLDFSIC